MLMLMLMFTLDCRLWNKAKVNYAFIFEFDNRSVLDWHQLAEVCEPSNPYVVSWLTVIATLTLPLPPWLLHLDKLLAMGHAIHVHLLPRHPRWRHLHHPLQPPTDPLPTIPTMVPHCLLASLLLWTIPRRVSRLLPRRHVLLLHLLHG